MVGVLTPVVCPLLPQLSEVLYEGQYTILYKGTARGIKEQKTIEVAIKSVKGMCCCVCVCLSVCLPAACSSGRSVVCVTSSAPPLAPPPVDDATEDDVKSLVCEMELLASLGPHPNIVSLMRVCTVGSEWLWHGTRVCRPVWYRGLQAGLVPGLVGRSGTGVGRPVWYRGWQASLRCTNIIQASIPLSQSRCTWSWSTCVTGTCWGSCEPHEATTACTPSPPASATSRHVSTSARETCSPSQPRLPMA